MSKKLPIIVALLFLSGCGGLSKQLDKQSDHPNSSFVYGFIDMDEASTPLEHFWLRQASPNPDPKCCAMRTHEGVFYLERILKQWAAAA